MKRVLQIVLGIAILVLIYIVVEQIMSPLRFNRDVATRKAAVISRIKDIRSAEQAFKQKNARYTGSFDTLIYFVLNDSLPIERTIGDVDDSVAVAQGLVKKEIVMVPAIETVFGRKVTRDEVNQLPNIPHSDGKKFILAAGMLTTESGVIVPVFEAKAPYKSFLADLDEQELVNLIDEEKNTLGRYPGIKVGSLEQATNDAGNWE